LHLPPLPALEPAIDKTRSKSDQRRAILLLGRAVIAKDKGDRPAAILEGAAEALQELQGKYRIAILTNGLYVVQRGRLARSAIRQHIDELIISEEIGFAKPAREFFNAAFAKLGHPSRRDTLMIGDGWNSDILGARQYGLDACWYNPGYKPRPDDGEITREIVSLRELIEWLG